MTFTDYLLAKKIDATQFSQDDPAAYARWLRLYEEMGAASFTVYMKFVLNKTRRKYILQ